MTGPRGKDSGFSLLEALIALTVFSVCAVTFLRVSQSYSRQVAGIESRALANIAAENELARQMAFAPAVAEETLLGVRMNLLVSSHTQDESGLVRIEILVRGGEDGMTLAQLTGFVQSARGR